ncbi:MAG: hypothetical protein WCX74_02670 [Candidatus Paceibacterota bacterium]
MKKYTLRHTNNPIYNCARIEELINGEWVKKEIEMDYKNGEDIETDKKCVFVEQ